MACALIFDSGVGGLSVSAEIRRLLPDLRQIYVADDVFRPYGEKPESALRARLPGLLKTLNLATTPDIIVLACNTASTAALEDIRSEVDVPVVGVVPAIKPAAENSQNKVIGVLGTPGTVRHKYVGRLIRDHARDCQVILHGSTKLVNEAERKLAGLSVDLGVLQDEIRPLFDGGESRSPDHIVLACTHFPLLKDELAEITHSKVSWVDSGAAIARRVETLLRDRAHEGREDNDIALLIGPPTGTRRQAAFARYGFERVIGLMPEGKFPDQE